MKTISTTVGAALGLTALCFISAAGAVPLQCKEASADHNFMHASEIHSCLAADRFGISEQLFSAYASRNDLRIAVPLVGRDQLDNWFVQFLNHPMLSSSHWRFDKVIDRSGRLTHIKNYGRAPAHNVPEPSALALFGFGLLGAAFLGRRKRIQPT